MKLYDCKTAPSPRRVRVFAAEKGIDLEKVEVDLSAGEQFSDAFRKKNADCVVPVLELDDGTCISEVLAICDYLEGLQPQPPLFGETAPERAAILEWYTKIEQQGLMAVAETFRNFAKGLKGHALTGPVEYEQIPQLAERGRQRVAVCLDRLEQQLAGNEFVAGDNYSIADITALVFVDFAAWVKIGIPDEADNLKRWHAAVSARPSARA